MANRLKGTVHSNEQKNKCGFIKGFDGKIYGTTDPLVMQYLATGHQQKPLHVLFEGITSDDDEGAVNLAVNVTIDDEIMDRRASERDEKGRHRLAGGADPGGLDSHFSQIRIHDTPPSQPGPTTARGFGFKAALMANQNQDSHGPSNQKCLVDDTAQDQENQTENVEEQMEVTAEWQEEEQGLKEDRRVAQELKDLRAKISMLCEQNGIELPTFTCETVGNWEKQGFVCHVLHNGQSYTRWIPQATRELAQIDACQIMFRRLGLIRHEERPAQGLSALLPFVPTPSMQPSSVAQNPDIGEDKQETVNSTPPATTEIAISSPPVEPTPPAQQEVKAMDKHINREEREIHDFRGPGGECGQQQGFICLINDQPVERFLELCEKKRRLVEFIYIPVIGDNGEAKFRCKVVVDGRNYVNPRLFSSKEEAKKVLSSMVLKQEWKRKELNRPAR